MTAARLIRAQEALARLADRRHLDVVCLSVMSVAARAAIHVTVQVRGDVTAAGRALGLVGPLTVIATQAEYDTVTIEGESCALSGEPCLGLRRGDGCDSAIQVTVLGQAPHAAAVVGVAS